MRIISCIFFKLFLIIIGLLSFTLLLAQGYPFLSLQLGYGGIKSGSTKVVTTKKELGFSYGVSGGYLFMVNNRLAIGPEVGYLGYPKSAYSTSEYGEVVKYTGYTLDLLVVGKLQLPHQFYALGKLGAAYVKQTFTMTPGLGYQYQKKQAKYLPEASIGIGYTINPHLNVDIAYRYIFGETNIVANLTPKLTQAKLDKASAVGAVTAWMLGINYHF